MDQSLRDLCLRKMITMEDALGRAIHPEELRKMITEGGGDVEHAGRNTRG